MNKTINKKQYDIPQQRRTTGLHDLFSVNIEKWWSYVIGMQLPL